MTEQYINALTKVYEETGFSVMAIRIRNSDGSEVLRLHCYRNGKLTKGFSFPMSELQSKIFKLKNYLGSLNPIQITAILDEIVLSHSKMAVIQHLDNLGLQFDDDKIVGYTCAESMDADGNRLVFDVEAQLPKAYGELGNVRDPLSRYLAANVKRQVVFLFALSSVLCGILKKNLILAVVGKSSTGKTALTKIALSSFCSPDYSRLSKTLHGTDNGILTWMNSLFGVPMLLDDASLKDCEKKTVRFDHLIYSLANGQSKGRITKGSELAPEFSWFSSVTISAEESILDRCSQKREGIVARLFEMHVSNKDLFKSANECDMISSLLSHCYGVIAPTFVRHIFNKVGIAKVTTMYEKEISSLRDNRNMDGLTARITGNIAVITLTAKLAKKALGIPFDTNGIAKLLLAITDENISDMRGNQVEHTVLTKVYPELIKCAKENFSKYMRNGYTVLPNSARNHEFRDLCNEFKLTPKQVKTALKNQKLLVVTDGAFGWHSTIGGEQVKGLALVLPTAKGGADSE